MGVRTSRSIDPLPSFFANMGWPIKKSNSACPSPLHLPDPHPSLCRSRKVPWLRRSVRRRRTQRPIASSIHEDKVPRTNPFAKPTVLEVRPSAHVRSIATSVNNGGTASPSPASASTARERNCWI